MITILFTGVGRRIELIQAFRQAALVLNKRIRIIGADIANNAPALPYCDAIKIVKPMDDPDYISSLLKTCEEEEVDILVPTIDTDLLTLANNREQFEKTGIRVLISTPDKIRICRDKNITSQFFVDCGLAAPMPTNSVNKYNSGFPAFIKPKDGSSSINAFKANSLDELKTYASKIEDYIIQPFIEGSEYTVDVFCDFGGKPIFITPRQRIQVRAGEVLKTQIAVDDTTEQEIRAICEKFKPCGPLTVQFIREKKSGINYYIEINPRFGGGAPLSMKAGAKSAEVLLKLIDEEALDESSYITQNGAIYSRFDQSVRITNEINKSIKGIIFDLDDTLYNEIEYVKSGFEAVSRYLGDASYASKLLYYFNNEANPIDKLLEEIGRIDEKDAVVDIYRKHKPRLTLDEAVAATLNNLRGSNIKLGIITDGRPEGQRAKIKALGIESYIDDIIVTDELGGKQFRKPNDISFRILQNRWRLAPEQIIYVGDNLNKDHLAPQQLGMNFVHYRNEDGLYKESNECNYPQITNIGDIKKYV